MFAIEALRQVLKLAPEHDLIWIAENGAEALAKCRENKPDLILMDLVMPVMNGVEATRRIMEQTPCAILLVTHSTASNLSMVYEAMGHGALDAVNTPVLGRGNQPEGARPLLNKIATIGKLLGMPSAAAPPPMAAPPPAAAELPRSIPPLVAIGASTGGPQAVEKILTRLPVDFPAAIVLTQHVDRDFAPGLAGWLQNTTRLKVVLAAEGERPRAGVVFLAHSADHLIVRSDRALGYTPDPVDYFYRPSVDRLFASAAEHWPSKGLGVLLTGMGKDGARGLLALRRAGWRTMAQDEKSCVVYGMPKAAVEFDAADHVVPIDMMADVILKWMSVKTMQTGGRT